MRFILLLICVVTLLASTGCVFWRGQGHAGDQTHTQYGDNDLSSGAGPSDAGPKEYPGDSNQRESP
jgi:hypothetical protein